METTCSRLLKRSDLFETDHRIIVVHGDADSGMTQDVLRLVRQEPHSLRTVFVVPNARSVAETAKGGVLPQTIKIVTPFTYHRIHHRLHDLIVIEDYETPTVEYEVLFRLIKKVPESTRIVFLSSNPHISRIESFLGSNLHTIKVSAPTPYPITVSYHTGNSIFKELADKQPFFRAIVFLNKQSACNYCLDKTRIPGYRIFAVHAGIPDYEMEAFRTCCQDLSQRMVIFCTSILERKIIPGIDLVIDVCLHTRAYQGAAEVCLANKAIMARRARRTGQTCPGRVIRLVSEDMFQTFPEDEDGYNGINQGADPSAGYEWSRVLMSLIKHRIDLFTLFDANSMPAATTEAIQAMLNELVRFRCITPNFRVTRIGKRAIRMGFPRASLFFSPILTAARIIGYWKNPRASLSLRDRLIYILVSLVVHQTGTGSGNLFWMRHPHRGTDPHIPFAGSDELHLRLNVLLNGLLAPSIDWFAKRYSINNKLLKDFRTMFQRVFRELDPAIAKDASLLLRVLRVDRRNRSADSLFSLREEDLDIIRCQSHPTVHWIQTYNSRYYTNVYASEMGDEYWATLRLPVNAYRPLKHLIPLVIQNETITLWVAPHTSLQVVRRSFDELRSTQALWQDIQNSRKEWKEVMDMVIEEIATEVAFRPGFVGAEEAATDFSNRLMSVRR